MSIPESSENAFAGDVLVFGIGRGVDRRVPVAVSEPAGSRKPTHGYHSGRESEDSSLPSEASGLAASNGWCPSLAGLTAERVLLRRWIPGPTDFTDGHVLGRMDERDPADLLPSERMETQTLEGEITQIHRGHRYAEEGDTFTIDGTTFEVTDVTERTLGDLTDEDARAEGMEDLEAYRDLLERAHENFEWDDDSEVVRHRFEPT